ncbi:MAG TPA: hypothetical protein V6C97_29720 [Oculatellaceae cyanobacterium]
MPSQDELRKRNERLAVEREDERRRLRKIEEEKERMRVKKEQERRHWDALAMAKMEAKKKEEMERAEENARKLIEEMEAAKLAQQNNQQ